MLGYSGFQQKEPCFNSVKVFGVAAIHSSADRSVSASKAALRATLRFARPFGLPALRVTLTAAHEPVDWPKNKARQGTEGVCTESFTASCSTFSAAMKSR